MKRSYHTWTVDVYGICTSEIETTVEKIEELLKYAPNFAQEINDHFKKWGIEEPDLDDYLEYDSDYYSGIAYIMQGVIKEAEDIQLDVAENFDCDWFLLLCPCYPWTPLTEKEKNLTDDILDDIFRKYVSILTDKEITIEYQSVENGG